MNAASIRAIWKRNYNEHPALAVVLLALVPLVYLGNTLVALATRWVVDAATGGQPVTTLIIASVAAGTAVALSSELARMVFGLEGALVSRASLRVEEDTLQLASRIPTIDRFSQPHVLDALASLRRSPTALAAYPWRILQAASAIVNLGLTTLVLILVNPWLWVLAFAGLLPIAATTLRAKIVQRADEAAIEATRREEFIHSLALENLSAHEIIVAGATGAIDEDAYFHGRLAARMETSARVAGGFVQALGWAAFGAVVAVVVLVSAGYFGGVSSLTRGDAAMIVVLAAGLQGQLAATLGGVADISVGARLARQLERVAALASTSSHEPIARIENEIRFEHVSFRYPGSAKWALQDVSVTVPAGTVLGVVGFNGAGKSTFTNLMLGLLEPTNGAVLIDGVAATALRGSSVAGAAFQDFLKPKLRLGEAVGIGDLANAGDNALILSALERAHGLELINELPEGLETQLGTDFQGAELSEGQWQRIAIARGLINRRSIIRVFDEPTSALDPQTEYEVFESFARDARSDGVGLGSISVVVSHRFTTVSVADLILTLDGGRVAALGTHQELIAQDGAYRAMFQAQRSAYQ